MNFVTRNARFATFPKLETTSMAEKTCRTICQFCHISCGMTVHRNAEGEMR